nr:probable inactive receptor kinase At5g67200 [Tanacetum cinerariifolium]
MCTPHHHHHHFTLLFIILLTITIITTTTTTSLPPSDAVALLKFKLKADTKNKLLYNLNEHFDYCQWQGVKCVQGRVVRLVLQNITLVENENENVNVIENRVVTISANDISNEVRILNKEIAMKVKEKKMELPQQHREKSGNLIFCEGSRSAKAKPLHWTSCLKIAEDIALGLAYIHQASRLIHNNLKSSNVLLGPDFEACLTDYCLLVLADPISIDESISTGYKAPELRKSFHRATTKSDVYAFGVLLLELLSGRPPSQHPHLVPEDMAEWVRAMRENDDMPNDNRLGMLVEVAGGRASLFLYNLVFVQRMMLIYCPYAVVKIRRKRVVRAKSVEFSSDDEENENENVNVIENRVVTISANDISNEVRILNKEIAMKVKEKKMELPQQHREKSGNLIFCEGEAAMYGLEQLMSASAELLGRGTIGTTYKAVMGNQLIVTVKRLDAGKTAITSGEAFEKHLEAVGGLRHPNLVPRVVRAKSVEFSSDDEENENENVNVIENRVVTISANDISNEVRILNKEIAMKVKEKKMELPQQHREKSGNLIFCEGEAAMYGLEQLMSASAELLGRGTIGTTYKAVMGNQLIVTVKRLDAGKTAITSGEAFEKHLEAVGGLRHPNLVPVRAYFQAKQERLVIYDYQPNGSLFNLIHGSRSAKAKPLHWTSCLKIAEDIALGLAYIHQASRLIHNNLKSS